MSESTDNYIKTIYALMHPGKDHVTTNELAEKLNTKASSVTDMLKKLDQRGFVRHTRYHGVSLTPTGEKTAVEIVRRHRIWEVFLCDKLGFGWEEVHDIAEQLEHITSAALIDRLEVFLEFPKFDPHGDPIPDSKGKLPKSRKSHALSELQAGEKARVISVDDSSSQLLQFLEKSRIKPGTDVIIKRKLDFDGSIHLRIKSKDVALSGKAAGFIHVQKLDS